ncbi:MAG: protein kinase [Gemmatimonadales bacterium]
MQQLSNAFTTQLRDRYEIERPIGAGGMATVYLARDRRHDRAVVVKVMHAELMGGDAADRFLREIQLTARLQHPHVLPLLDSGIADGTSYYVMPYVPGESLRARLDREGPLPIDVVLQVTGDVASALDYAHAQGVIHRDIKPENILLGADHAIVADFGIARALGDVGGTRLTATGLAVGTPAYMSPEQATGSATDARSDLYSLGCVLYEMLTGHAPFSGRTPQEVMVRHAVDSVPTLRAARPGLSPVLETVIATALAKAPADRYQTGRALMDALTATATTQIGTVHHGVRRRWKGVALVGAGVLAMSLILWRSTAEGAFGSRDWILVGDFVGDSLDPSLARALRGALMVSLQQSRYVNVEPASAVSATFRMMGRPDSTTLTEAVAREAGLRMGARAVLVPALSRLEPNVLLTARVLSPQSGDEILSVQERAAGRAQLLEALDRLAVGVRKQLGERLRAAEPVVPLHRATTGSLEALRAWTLGNEHFRNGRYNEAQGEYERALALDSNFAMAHKGLAVTLYWLNQRAKGDPHFERALALRDRMTDREFLLIQAEVAQWRERTDSAVQLYHQVLSRYPDDLSARFSLGFTLLGAGRCAEALDQYEWLRVHDTTDVSVRINLATCYGNVGRFTESIAQYRAAFAIRPQMVHTGSNIVHEFGQALVWSGHPESAESLFTVQLGGAPDAKARAHRSLALLDLYRGRNAAARDLLRQAITEDKAAAAATSELRDRMYLCRALLDAGKVDSARTVLREAAAFAERQPLDPVWPGHLGELAANLGDAVTAAAIERQVSARAQAGNRSDELVLHRLRGELAAHRGDRTAAREQFEGALAALREPMALAGAGRAALAENRPKDAEALYAEVVTQHVFLSEALPAFFEAKLALGRLAAARGDTVAARQQIGWLVSLWAQGDSDLVVGRAAARELRALGK